MTISDGNDSDPANEARGSESGAAESVGCSQLGAISGRLLAKR